MLPVLHLGGRKVGLLLCKLHRTTILLLQMYTETWMGAFSLSLLPAVISKLGHQRDTSSIRRSCRRSSSIRRSLIGSSSSSRDSTTTRSNWGALAAAAAPA